MLTLYVSCGPIIFLRPSPAAPSRPAQRPRPVVLGCSRSLQLHFNSIFTFPFLRPSLPSMTNFWFSATYYVFLGYNRRRLQSRVQ